MKLTLYLWADKSGIIGIEGAVSAEQMHEVSVRFEEWRKGDKALVLPGATTVIVMDGPSPKRDSVPTAPMVG